MPRRTNQPLAVLDGDAEYARREAFRGAWFDAGMLPGFCRRAYVEALRGKLFGDDGLGDPTEAAQRIAADHDDWRRKEN